MSAISRNKIEVSIDHSNILILYDRDNQRAAIKLAADLRDKDKKIELVRQSAKHNIEAYIEYAKKTHFSGIYHFLDDDNVEVISLHEGIRETVKASELY